MWSKVLKLSQVSVYDLNDRNPIGVEVELQRMSNISFNFKIDFLLLVKISEFYSNSDSFDFMSIIRSCFPPRFSISPLELCILPLCIFHHFLFEKYYKNYWCQQKAVWNHFKYFSVFKRFPWLNIRKKSFFVWFVM